MRARTSTIDSLRAEVVIALVDDDEALRFMARSWLESERFTVRDYSTGHGLLEALSEEVAVVVLDLGLHDVPGIELLRHLRAINPDLAIIVATARRDLESAVECMRLGACDYLAKPLDPARLLHSVTAALERSQAAEQVRRRRAGSSGPPTVLGSVIGQSTSIRAMAAQAERVLESDVTVCLFGESGVGKEVVAHAIHDNGSRRHGPFIAVNCAAIPASLQESELFGHERGAFTGASGTHRGRFEQAENGTLFLDELGEMSPATQVVLLRTLQERTIRRVGGVAEIRIDVRIICATHRDLEAEVEAGRFRKDLYYRLVVFPVDVPPLRARRDDIPLLVAHFLKKLRDDVGRDVTRVSPEALDAMARYPWPGNVRELQNVVHRAMLSCDHHEITLAHLPSALRRAALPELPPAPPPRKESPSAAPSDEVIPLAELERRAIERALVVAGGSVSRAARLLGMGRTTLYRRLAELGVTPEVP